jgi:hypothetical protein
MHVELVLFFHYQHTFCLTASYICAHLAPQSHVTFTWDGEIARVRFEPSQTVETAKMMPLALRCEAITRSFFRASCCTASLSR